MDEAISGGRAVCRPEKPMITETYADLPMWRHRAICFARRGGALLEDIICHYYTNSNAYYVIYIYRMRDSGRSEFTKD